MPTIEAEHASLIDLEDNEKEIAKGTKALSLECTRARFLENNYTNSIHN
jgi:hypothetical protein